MKKLVLIVLVLFSFSCNTKTVNSQSAANAGAVDGKDKHLFLDVHNLEPGKVAFAAVAEAHQKDLATQDKFGVSFIKYWVDEKAGKVYCLAESPDSASVSKTHKEAHGLVPDLVQRVSEGQEAHAHGKHTFFLDIHRLDGVTAEAVAEAHLKDLAVQGKHDVNFINYWVDEKLGIVTCLSEARDSTSVINTHREAHGLLPDEIHPVKQGQ